MAKELNREKLRKKKEKEKRKEKKKRWKRINAKVDRTIYALAVGICVTYYLLETKEKREAEAAPNG